MTEIDTRDSVHSVVLVRMMSTRVLPYLTELLNGNARHLEVPDVVGEDGRREVMAERGDQRIWRG